MELLLVRGGEAAFCSGKARTKALILLRKISESERLWRSDCGFAAPDKQAGKLKVKSAKYTIVEFAPQMD